MQWKRELRVYPVVIALWLARVCGATGGQTRAAEKRHAVTWSVDDRLGEKR